MKHSFPLSLSLFPTILTAILLSGCGDKSSTPSSSENQAGKETHNVVAPSGAARQAIEERLDGNGLKVGVSERGVIVVTDNAFPCKDPTSAPHVLALREHCLTKALEDAKANIAVEISRFFSPEEIKSDFSGNAMSLTETSRSLRGVGGDEEAESIISMHRSSQLTLGGFRVLDVAESWDAETMVVEMAVAVVWSRKAQQQSKDEAEGRTSPKHPLSTAELEKWMDDRDGGLLVGPRTVKDENGVLHYLGIGTADADGPSEKARMMSEMSAKRFATFPRLSRIAVEDVVKDDNYSRQFAETPVSDNCRFLTLGFLDAVHPVSGKKLVLAIVEALD